jgi:D-alanine-D-alanine ligase
MIGAMLRRVLVLYNTDYDEELIAASKVDVSEVKAAAMAVHRAVAAFGLDAELAGVHGRDLEELIVRLRHDPPDLVFNLCESLCGDTRNEVVIPAVLDMMGVAYTGPGPLAIGLCLHKDRTKGVLHQRGLPTPPGIVVTGEAELDDPTDPLGLGALAYPYFLKLVREDASVGIEAGNLVADRPALIRRARELLAGFKQPVLCERFIAGREVNVTVLGNDEGARALPLHEIDFGKMPLGRPRILTYAAKWDEKHVDYEGSKPVPMRDIAPDVARAVEAAAVQSFRALGLRDFGRVDLRIDEAGQPWVIDVNPNCDLSPDAGFSRAARAAGFDYPQIIGRICELGWERHVHRRPGAQPL